MLFVLMRLRRGLQHPAKRVVHSRQRRIGPIFAGLWLSSGVKPLARFRLQFFAPVDREGFGGNGLAIGPGIALAYLREDDEEDGTGTPSKRTRPASLPGRRPSLAHPEPDLRFVAQVGLTSSKP